MRNRSAILIQFLFCLCCFGQNEDFQKKFQERHSISFSVYCDTTKSLSFVEAGLLKFPFEILFCENIIHLDLSMNNFEMLPSEINQLSNLEELYISYSSLKQIPLTIGDLSKLKVLWLLDDDISVLPKEISELENLEVLNLNGNPIRTLPEEFFNLQCLKKLYLGQWDGIALFTIQEQENIKNRLPNCEVKF